MTGSAREDIRALGLKHDVSPVLPDFDRQALAISYLSGNDGVMDDEEYILVALRRKGILSEDESFEFLMRLFDESEEP